MGIFDFLSHSTGKHLPMKKLDKMLREIRALSPEEREYVKAVFSRYQTNGITKEEANRAVRTLLENMKDTLTHGEAEKVKMKILSFFV